MRVPRVFLTPKKSEVIFEYPNHCEIEASEKRKNEIFLRGESNFIFYYPSPAQFKRE